MSQKKLKWLCSQEKREKTTDHHYTRAQEKRKHKYRAEEKGDKRQRGSKEVRQKAFNKHVSIVTEM